MTVAGLVLGILSVVTFGYGFIFAIIGLPLSVSGGSKLKKEGKTTGIGTAGLVLNIIGLSFSVILGLVFIGAFIYGYGMGIGIF
jgi:hypothetical protein